MNKLFLILSGVFSPLLVPTYGLVLAMYLSVPAFLPAATLWGTIAVVCFMTAAVPTGGIMLMKRLGIIGDALLADRSERTAPFVVSAVCYLAATFYLMRVHAPAWLVAYLAGGCAAVVIDTVVTRWWKISVHMTAMGGLVALLCSLQAFGIATHDLTWWIVGAILFAGLVGTARVWRQRHTLGQVAAGTAVGFVCVWFAIYFALLWA